MGTERDNVTNKTWETGRIDDVCVHTHVHVCVCVRRNQRVD